VVDPFILARGVHFAATILASGTVFFVVLVAEPAVNAAGFKALAKLRRQLTGVVWLALAIAVLSGAVWLVLLASDILGATIADVCLHGGAWSVLTDTRFGLVWCARLALALTLGLLLLWPATRWLQVTAAATFLALPAMVGHAGATPGPGGELHLASDMLHLLAAGAWLGGLPAFAILLWHTCRGTQRRRSTLAALATARFSVLGILSVGALLASGLIISWNLLGTPRAIIVTEYGRLVALKIGLFGAMIALAAVNRFYLTPQLPKPAAFRGLQRNTVAEICLGLCVLQFVGILGTLPPAAHVHAAPVGIPPDAAFVHIHTAEAMADVTIDPGRAGRTDVMIRVSREDLSLFPAKDIRLALDPPTAGGHTLERAAVKQSDGTWLIEGMTIAQSGIWTARVIVQPGQGAPIVLDAPIVIER
jgi:putative copper resistance protein D